MAETWITPKTNWKPADFFNLSDYERITGNIRYLHELAVNLYAAPFASLSVMSALVIGSIVRAPVLNAVESNVTKLGTSTFLLADWQEGKTFSAGDTAWDHNDLNRIEKNLEMLKNMLDSQQAGLKTLAFELGGGDFG